MITEFCIIKLIQQLKTSTMSRVTKTLSCIRMAATGLSTNSRRPFTQSMCVARIFRVTSASCRDANEIYYRQALSQPQILSGCWKLSSFTPMTARNYSTTGNEGKKLEEKPLLATQEEPKLSLFQKFKKMYKEYWYVLIPVHCVTSAFWFGSFYYLAISGVDIVPLLEKLGASETIIKTVGNSGAGYIAVAYGMYKIATPARYTVTLGGTTISINYLRKWGYIKPIPSREKMTEMIHEKRIQLRSQRAKVLAKMNLRRKRSSSNDNEQ
ncbi:hypothetical protein CHUAL_011784 [Chamberlinius hualienensis]